MSYGGIRLQLSGREGRNFGSEFSWLFGSFVMYFEQQSNLHGKGFPFRWLTCSWTSSATVDGRRKTKSRKLVLWVEVGFLQCKKRSYAACCLNCGVWWRTTCMYRSVSSSHLPTCLRIKCYLLSRQCFIYWVGQHCLNLVSFFLSQCLTLDHSLHLNNSH